MNRKQLGNSHLSVTPIGLGLAALGRPGYINLGHGDDLNYDHDVTAMEAQAHRVLDSAWDVGIRYFDAARSYETGALQRRSVPLAPNGVTPTLPIGRSICQKGRNSKYHSGQHGPRSDY